MQRLLALRLLSIYKATNHLNFLYIFLDFRHMDLAILFGF